MPHWNSHSRDIIENLKRFYVNQLLDADKQLAINVFLGVENDRVITGNQMKFGGYDSWYDPEKVGLRPQDTFRQRGPNGHSEGSKETVAKRSCGHGECRFDLKASEEALARFADLRVSGEGETGIGPGTGWNSGTSAEFWVEYYRPLLFTALGKHFSYCMNSTLKLPG
jgi:phosphatidylinositol 3,5-bisphosphate 5-phosphatase